MKGGRKRSHAIMVLVGVVLIGCAAVITTKIVEDSLSMRRTFRTLQAKVEETESKSSRLEEEAKNLSKRLQAMDVVVQRLSADGAWGDPLEGQQRFTMGLQAEPGTDGLDEEEPNEPERHNGIGADGKYHWYPDKAGEMLGWKTMRKKAPDDEVSNQEMLVKAEEKYKEDIRTRGPWPRDRQESYDFYTRAFYLCRSEENVGNPGWTSEGGKWMCELDQLKDKAIVYSVGSAGETGFEDAIYERYPNCDIHTFDHSLDPDMANKLAQNRYFKFHDWGLTSPVNQDSSPKLKTLKDIMKELKHEHISIFKIDCEGCEWGVFEDIFNGKDNSFAPFDQIQVELHDLFEFGGFASLMHTVKQYATATERLNDFVKRLEDHGFRLFHWELNYQDFNCAELAFIHERVVRPPTTTA